VPNEKRGNARKQVQKPVVGVAYHLKPVAQLDMAAMVSKM
jgi:hypothetical protein